MSASFFKKYGNIGNILSNYGNKLWSIVSVFIFIPLYIKYLGVESFAVIGFYSLLLGIISFADSGLSSAVIKEFSSSSERNYKYSVLRLIEKYYILICIGICVVIFATAPLIAKYWLTSETIAIDDLTYYLRLISIGIVIHLLSLLYYGALFGLNYQIEANFYQIIWNIFKSLGVVLILIVVDKTLEVFFIWQIICNLVYVIVIRFRVLFRLKDLGQKLQMVINKIPQDIIKYISGMILIAIVSALNTQADKIMTSSMLSLKIYGYYTLSSTLGQVPVMLAMPLAVSMFPIFSKLVSASETPKLKSTFEKSSFILNNLVIIAGILLILYMKDVLLLWTKKSIEPAYLPDVIISCKLLVIGSVFLSLQFIFYYVLLSYGKTKYTIVQGVVQLLVGMPVLYLLVWKLGVTGAGISWILINLGSFIFLFIILSRQYLKFSRIGYIFNNMLIPLMISAGVSLAVYSLSINFMISIIISGVISLLLNVVCYNIRNGYKVISYSGLVF
ncbi:MAG: polysaccharide biosynthesis C-terminal domain-containing protein [Chryseobacterium sp.]|jgi:O-antigen/teichoic acid export membrane protein|uniref:lipopolysaccharide biosynthesis protein n=1 Tax=Chryseobacterium sp. TaxID=1871047 RepID=UPI002830C9CE|nr:oligosaccharide flippase family protein [Chryseobacterium sp.]MDR2236527.1 polysaccharide biosynthesis C-terminal domain-containing protein [Chryseobacterium sp.]